MKKIYTIEITGHGSKNIWYFDKIGQRFEAELKAKNYNALVCFTISVGRNVRPEDCKVVGERLTDNGFVNE